MARAILGLILGLFVRLWLATLRVTEVAHPALHRCTEAPWALALWHGQLLPLLAHRRRRSTIAMVSLSPDGDLLSNAMRVIGVRSARGSSSRGGAAALDQILERMSSGWDGAFAVDGPRGPRRKPHRGVLVAARRSEGVVVPYAAACSHSIALTTSWDHFEIPLPFTRVAVVLGEPLLVPQEMHAGDTVRLGEALEKACAQARAQIALSGHAPRLAPQEET